MPSTGDGVLIVGQRLRKITHKKITDCQRAPRIAIGAQCVRQLGVPQRLGAIRGNGGVGGMRESRLPRLFHLNQKR
jgi:hypothetical protein